MATKTYAVGDNEVVKIWSKRLAREALKATVIYPMIKDSGSALITLAPETQKGPGDRVRVALRMQFSADGVTEAQTQEGNEEVITTYTDDVILGELSNAYRNRTTMAQQRVAFDIAKEGNDALADWHAARLDQVAMYHMAGYTPANSLAANGQYNGFNTITAPTSGRQLWTESGATQDSDLDSSGDELTLAMIDKARELAETGGSTGLVPIRPIKGLPGGAKYVCIVHPTQVTSLRTSTSTNNWMDLQKALLQGGSGEESMIFKGGLGIYNETLIMVSNRVPYGVTAGGAAITTVRRAIFAGAQALIMAFGQGYGPEEWRIRESTFDYDREYGQNALCLYGIKKSVFNSKDFATIVISSYAADAA